jgi:hypothetical protein
VGTTEAGFLRVGREQTMGVGANLTHGRIANRYQPRGGFSHPWTLQPFWDAEFELTEAEQVFYQRKKGSWCCYVVPGFLNGHPPAIKVKAGHLGDPKTVKVWGNGYGKKSVGNPDQLVQVLLTDQPKPFIRLTSLANSTSKVMGADGSVSGGEVPTFFRVRGAMKAEELTGLDILNNIVINGGSEFILRIFEGTAPDIVTGSTRETKEPFAIPEGNRLLFKCDVVLQVDRPATKQVYAYDDIGLLRYNGFDIQLPPHDEYSARLYSIGVYTPPKAPSYFDVIFGTYQEIMLDEIVIGSVWLLSPIIDLLDNFEPDGSWLSFVRNDVFWNLNYSSIIQIDPFQQDRSLEWFKGILSFLAGGTAYLFAVSVVNPLEASYDVVNTAMNETAVRGQFWTG